MYGCSFILLDDGSSKRTAKGVKRSYLKKHIDHANYVKCLTEEETTMANFLTIQSVNHHLMTVEINKKALSAFDDKKYLLDNISSLPYGHKQIKTLRDSAM